jgi:hypothetical protein
MEDTWQQEDGILYEGNEKCAQNFDQEPRSVGVIVVEI